MVERYQVTEEDIRAGLDRLERELARRLSQNGFGIFVSTHEVLGVVQEEIHELHDAVKSNDNDAVAQECWDIAVGALFGYISHHTGRMDW